jgi:hypothetical protein
MAAPAAGLPLPVLIVERFAAGRDVGLYVLSPRGAKPAAPPGPFLPEKGLLSGRGPEDGLRPSSLVSYAEPLLRDSLLLVLAQERWAGIRLVSRFSIAAAAEVVLRTAAPVAALRLRSSCL